MLSETFRKSRIFCSFSTRSSLLRRVRSGNEAAWFEFHDRYVRMVRHIGTQRGLSAVECDELMADVMLIFWRKIDSFFYDPGRGRFRSYLATIADFAARKIFRNNRKKPEIPFTGDYPADVDAAEMEEWRDHLLKTALAELRESVDTVTYEAFYMLAVQGRPVEEVSAVTRKSANTLYGIRFRCTRKLKRIISAYRKLEDGALDSAIRTEKAGRTESRKTPRPSE
ncbi:MAG: sigma-70 family RNA polymerase sigma factor [Lentisphaeria bacterium]|nr:sigma-70 family RNA polymerase sigma factor [Lentisphaeria bacterium]